MNPARRTPHHLSLAILATVLALVTAACGSSNPLGGGSASGDPKSIVVGSADFPESKIIAEIWAQALEANGFSHRTCLPAFNALIVHSACRLLGSGL